MSPTTDPAGGLVSRASSDECPFVNTGCGLACTAFNDVHQRLPDLLEMCEVIEHHVSLPLSPAGKWWGYPDRSSGKGRDGVVDV